METIHTFMEVKKNKKTAVRKMIGILTSIQLERKKKMKELENEYSVSFPTSLGNLWIQSIFFPCPWMRRNIYKDLIEFISGNR